MYFVVMILVKLNYAVLSATSRSTRSVKTQTISLKMKFMCPDKERWSLRLVRARMNSVLVIQSIKQIGSTKQMIQTTLLQENFVVMVGEWIESKLRSLAIRELKLKITMKPCLRTMSMTKPLRIQVKIWEAPLISSAFKTSFQVADGHHQKMRNWKYHDWSDVKGYDELNLWMI